MERDWKVKEKPDTADVQFICEQINVNHTLGMLLAARGIKTFEEAKDFFRPNLNQIHDPMLMMDMEKSVRRLKKAIDTEEHIVLYSDYDVDGTTALAMMYTFISSLHENVSVYIPDRYSEGYGVSEKGIKEILKRRASLLITLDCGIRAVETLEYAKMMGVDTIVCDHHEPGDVVPNIFAILDPRMKKCRYPYKELSGCGVGFKLLQAFIEDNDYPEEMLFTLLDFVAISIACDIVPITGENRVLAHAGLQLINETPRAGIAALLEVANKKGQITIDDLVFGIGPRINASGRMAHAMQAFELLVERDEGKASKMAQVLDKNNITRKEQDKEATELALQMIEEEDQEGKHTNVLYYPKWHKGIIGIVASRCIERSYRPTIILTKSGDMVTGSARSIEGFDVYQALLACEDLLEQFGGHKYAAGMTLKEENVEAFKEAFEAHVKKLMSPELMSPCIKVDCHLKLDDITDKFMNILEQMHPFGPGNMKPVFVSEAVFDTGRAKLLKDQHLKMSVKQTDSRLSFDAIGFFMADKLPLVLNGQHFKMVYHLERNFYLGRSSIQIVLVDVKPQ